jgi:uncharacterized membrane protein
MVKKLYEILQPVKFRLTVLGLLCGATLCSIILFRIRTVIAGSLEYFFLVWNVFLAWIPLGLAYLARIFAGKRRSMHIFIPLAALLWILFFPNAPYILTDLLHLAHPRAGVPLWFDMLMIIWFAWTGLLLGLVSLFLMHGIVIRRFGRAAGWGFVLSAGFLSSLGVYIGRFLRWNSWDLFLQPLVRISDLMYYAAHPGMRSILFIGGFSALFLFIYIMLYAFGLLFQEQSKRVFEEVE